MLERAPVALVCLDEDGQITDATPRGVWLLTGAADPPIGASMPDLLSPHERDRAVGWLAELRRLPVGHLAHLSVQAVGGRPRHLELSGTNLLADPSVRALAVCVQDVTEQRVHELTLAAQAFEDPLTGLANRALLLDRIEQLAMVSRQETAVLFVDLDQFKKVNDQMGHAVGDDLLRGVATALREVLPATATIGRIGGDEFVVVAPRMGADEAMILAVSMIERIKQVRLGVPGAPRVSASIGVATAVGPVAGRDLLQRADAAMYRAKAAGRGSAAHHDPDEVAQTSADLAHQMAELLVENERLQELVGTDALTGIGNLRRYQERLADVSTAARQGGTAYSLLFCDLDAFGRYNKRFGQQQGDDVLRAVVDSVVQRLRPGDEVHRRGGEELVVILPGTTGDGAVMVAERMRTGVQDLQLDRGELDEEVLTISIGVATFDPQRPVEPGDLELLADRAMSLAKQAGKNQVVRA